MIVAANIFSLIGNIFLTISPFCKTKKKIITFQLIDTLTGIVALLLLKAYTGVIMAVCATIRNTLFLKFELSKKMSALIVIVIGVLAFLTNNMGLLGLLPIVGTIIYSCVIFFNKNVLHLLFALLLDNLLYLIYNFYLLNYAASIFKFIAICTTLFNILKLIKKKKHENLKED